jgi:8-oxo-dGTP pyrophosphatase MutT (NUDIX family)
MTETTPPSMPPAQAAEKPAPVVPKPAASLLVLRMGAISRKAEVLMGMRGAKHKFMPNRLVFPGGRVDPEDHGVAPASDMPELTWRRLLRGADESLARAIGIAAARELDEETGLTLGAPPLLHGLDYLCRAITPESSPMRFDARFLVVDAEHVTGTLAGSGELENLSWYDVAEALEMVGQPTKGVLRHLVDWMAMDHGARAVRDVVSTMRERDWEPE